MGPRTIPKRFAFYLLAGGIYENRQDWEHAKQQYQKVLEIQPENPLASNNLAYVMLQQGGNVDVAFAMAQTARRQLPDNPNTADTLGWAFYQKHVYTSAISLFKEAVKKEPDNALFNFHLGLAYAKSGQADLGQATTGPRGEDQAGISRVLTNCDRLWSSSRARKLGFGGYTPVTTSNDLVTRQDSVRKLSCLGLSREGTKPVTSAGLSNHAKW